MKRSLVFLLALSACARQSDNGVAANDSAPSPTVAPGPVANAAAGTPAAEAVAIPAKFQGVWANTPSACADPEHYSRVAISDRTLRFQDYTLIGEHITLPAPDEFVVQGKIEGAGKPGEAHFSLNKYGDLLRDEGGGGSNRVHCP